MNAPKVVFCTTCKNRTFHLAHTLPKNIADNPHSLFVVLDYGSQDNLLDTVRPYLDPDRLAVYSYRTEGPFHMAHAKNMAHRLGMLEGGDVLVNVDADNYTGPGFGSFIEGCMAAAKQSQTGMFLWSGLVKGLGRKLRGVSGRIAVTPGAFIKAGGYDERFDTWAPDDKDFNLRLQRLGYRGVEIARHYLEAIPHGNGIRFREYPHAQVEESEGTIEVQPRPSAVVNGGSIGIGEVFRTDGERINLGPVPTRIFGIGMHKTATTSLHEALKILGYESAHWPSGDWARKVWEEMQGQGVSPSLEKYYAASDLPITLLYRQLDRAYPGSKFILTMRNEIDWLKSVSIHFSWRNPYRWEWDAYPFPNRIHQALYGRRDFDALVFLERYRRHNAEVMEYFKDRPDDLLVMDMERSSWKELCGFLGKPVPVVEYPRALVTR